MPDLLGSLFVALTLDLACSFELGESALRVVVIVMHLQHQLLPLGPQHEVARLWCILPRLEQRLWDSCDPGIAIRASFPHESC